MLWLEFKDLVDYQDALTLMEKKVERVIQDPKEECVFLLEHKDVYTAGTSSIKEELINNNNIPVIFTGRGGKLTYHGKGQLIIYPILSLANREKDIKHYVHNLEQWIILTFAELGVEAYTMKNLVGIWVDTLSGPAKIAAIGIRVRKWVTYHGIAVNIATNLDMYKGIIPCGIKEFSVTSLLKIGIKIQNHEIIPILKTKFEMLF